MQKIIKYIQKNSGLFISIIVFFFIIYWNSKDWIFSFQFTLFVCGMFLFNFAVCYYYKDLKANRFNFKATGTAKSWIYFGFFTVGTVVAFLIFLPKIFWVYAAIMSGILLVTLFIFDLIINGLR